MRIRATSLLALLLAPCGGCSSGTSSPSEPATVETRGYRMGFSAFPPRPNLSDYERAVGMWVQRADAAILHESPPWAALLSGTPRRST